MQERPEHEPTLREVVDAVQSRSDRDEAVEALARAIRVQEQRYREHAKAQLASKQADEKLTEARFETAKVRRVLEEILTTEAKNEYEDAYEADVL